MISSQVNKINQFNVKNSYENLSHEISKYLEPLQTHFVI